MWLEGHGRRQAGFEGVDVLCCFMLQLTKSGEGRYFVAGSNPLQSSSDQQISSQTTKIP